MHISLFSVMFLTFCTPTSNTEEGLLPTQELWAHSANHYRAELCSGPSTHGCIRNKVDSGACTVELTFGRRYGISPKPNI